MIAMRTPFRRAVAVVGVAAVVAGAWAAIGRPWDDDSAPTAVTADAPAVADTEAARRSADAAVREIDLTAAPATIDLGDRTVETWAFNGTVPGPEIRLQSGDVVRATVRNDLPQPLTIHWHGIALRNDMDGVPDVTQDPIAPGAEFVYEFTALDPGTYFYHPHTGMQLDRGLYAPLIVEDPAAPSGERDIAVLLDDWIDGTGTNPDEVLADLQAEGMAGMDMGGMDMGGADEGGDTDGPDMGDMDMGDMGGMDMATADQPLGSDTGDVDYPLYLINGRAPAAPAELDVEPGERVRLRLINAASDTPFRVAVGGSRLTVVATDGFPVEPVTVDTLLLGMGERYDVIVTAPADGAAALVAVAEGKDASAMAVLRAGDGDAPAPDTRPAELEGDLLTLDDLTADPAVVLEAREPDRTSTVTLTADMEDYRWGIAVPEEDGVTLPVREGERVRLVITNETMMWHPIHLHGQTFQVTDGPRKDTVVVGPMETVTVEFDADNPGQWTLHCHNLYHAESGMTTVLSYVS